MPLLVSENPEKTPKPTKQKFVFALFCPVWLKICPDEGREEAGLRSIREGRGGSRTQEGRRIKGDAAGLRSRQEHPGAREGREQM